MGWGCSCSIPGTRSGSGALTRWQSSAPLFLVCQQAPACPHSSGRDLENSMCLCIESEMLGTEPSLASCTCLAPFACRTRCSPLPFSPAVLSCRSRCALSAVLYAYPALSAAQLTTALLPSAVSSPDSCCVQSSCLNGISEPWLIEQFELFKSWEHIST